LHSGQRPRVHPARRRHLRGLRAHVSVDAARADRVLPSADRPFAGAGAVIDATPLLHLGLLLVRPGTLIVAAPPFGSTFAPAAVKIGLTVLLALVLVPVVDVPT